MTVHASVGEHSAYIPIGRFGLRDASIKPQPERRPSMDRPNSMRPGPAQIAAS